MYGRGEGYAGNVGGERRDNGRGQEEGSTANTSPASLQGSSSRRVSGEDIGGVTLREGIGSVNGGGASDKGIPLHATTRLVERVERVENGDVARISGGERSGGDVITQSVYDVKKLKEEGCTMNKQGQVFNQRGYVICGVLNQHDRPCQRIGRCPFHPTKNSIIINAHLLNEIEEDGAGGQGSVIGNRSNNGGADVTGSNAGNVASGSAGAGSPLGGGMGGLGIYENITGGRRPYKRGWTKEEHFLFLIGLELHGKGRWKAISSVVTSRTPTQIQSHAQKFFLRQKQKIKNKRSIHDLTLESPEMIHIDKTTDLRARAEATIQNLDPANMQTNLHAQAFQVIANSGGPRSPNFGRDIVRSIYRQQAAANLKSEPTLSSFGPVFGGNKSYPVGGSTNTAAFAAASAVGLATGTNGGDGLQMNAHLTSTTQTSVGLSTGFHSSLHADLNNTNAKTSNGMNGSLYSASVAEPHMSTVGSTTVGMHGSGYNGSVNEPHHALVAPSPTAHALLSHPLQYQQQQQPNRASGVPPLYSAPLPPLSYNHGTHATATEAQPPLGYSHGSQPMSTDMPTSLGHSHVTQPMPHDINATSAGMWSSTAGVYNTAAGRDDRLAGGYNQNIPSVSHAGTGIHNDTQNGMGSGFIPAPFSGGPH